VSRLAIIAVACIACEIPTAQDQQIAVDIGRYIEKGYGRFVDREAARESGGPVWYARGRPGRRATIILYEVTSPGDIALVEQLAREALRATEGAKSVTLQFYGKQNWRYQGSTGMRGPEKLIREVTFDRED